MIEYVLVVGVGALGDQSSDGSDECGDRGGLGFVSLRRVH